LQLLGRTHHALRLHAAQLADLDFERLAVRAWRQHGAGLGANGFHACTHIRRAADDIEQGARADIDLAHVQAVRIRMAHDFDHFSDDHVGKRRRDGLDFFDFEAGHRQQVGQFA
jgi:hypothetical protein